MFLNYVDVVSLTTSPPQGVVKQLDSQLISIKRQVDVLSPPRASPLERAERLILCVLLVRFSPSNSPTAS